VYGVRACAHEHNPFVTFLCFFYFPSLASPTPAICFEETCFFFPPKPIFGFTVQVIRTTAVSIFVYVTHPGEKEQGGGQSRMGEAGGQGRDGGQRWEEEEENKISREKTRSVAALRRRVRSRLEGGMRCRRRCT